MDSCDTLLVSLVLIFCLLHGWFAAAMAAVRTLGGRLKSMMEKEKRLSYYWEKKAVLLNAETVEFAVFCISLEILTYFYASVKGFLPSLREALMFRYTNVAFDDMLYGGMSHPFAQIVIIIVLLGLAALVLALLTDGMAKGLGRKNPQKITIKSVGYVHLIMTLLLPFRALHTGMNQLFGGKQVSKEMITEEQILQMVDAVNATGAIEEQQREMINNIFEFDDITISEVMTHRKELVAVDVEMEIQEVVDLARNENYSRMPVYQDSVDNIIGILNTKDLLGLIGCKNISGFSVRYFMREALFVPETAKCDDVLSDMSRKKMQMAIVVDEYGGTAGVVCMEDILEEIVGNIQDEYDEEEAAVHRITDSLYTIDGHADPEDAFLLLGLELPEEMPFDTVSGFVVDLLGRIPEAHENPSVEWQHVRFTVLAMEDNWISKIKAEILPVEKGEDKKNG
ncbi:hemolysin family protein [Ruminococcus sp.]|uniref:hemolysin family protein n=1 Tax=Ruminococcus sp. TaxID=41978 RepID=UPI0025F183E5|nr:hemolysin family protein [Ruminococcus sp.]